MHPDSHGNVIYYVRVFKHYYQIHNPKNHWEIKKVKQLIFNQNFKLLQNGY